MDLITLRAVHQTARALHMFGMSIGKISSTLSAKFPNEKLIDWRREVWWACRGYYQPESHQKPDILDESIT